MTDAHPAPTVMLTYLLSALCSILSLVHCLLSVYCCLMSDVCSRMYCSQAHIVPVGEWCGRWRGVHPLLAAHRTGTAEHRTGTAAHVHSSGTAPIPPPSQVLVSGRADAPNYVHFSQGPTLSSHHHHHHHHHYHHYIIIIIIHTIYITNITFLPFVCLFLFPAPLRVPLF